MGSTQKIDEETIKYFVNNIQRIWIDEHGVRILGDHFKERASDLYIPKFSKNHRFNYNLARINNVDINLQAYFHKVFDSLKYKKFVDEYLITSQSPLVIEVMNLWEKESSFRSNFIVPFEEFSTWADFRNASVGSLVKINPNYSLEKEKNWV